MLSYLISSQNLIHWSKESYFPSIFLLSSLQALHSNTQYTPTSKLITLNEFDPTMHLLDYSSNCGNRLIVEFYSHPIYHHGTP